MVDGRLENIFLVNAPAGSGKTTLIRKMVIEHLRKEPQDNIVCITYTNRAANELRRGIDSPNVFIGTIHSFLNEFLKPFFSMQEICDLYWDMYKEKIRDRILNSENKANVTSGNERYIKKYGDISEKIVRKNLLNVSYGETPNSSLYYGRLSHDDLIIFARKVIEKFPIVRRKLTDKFQLAFIDEYQDTSADVLFIFYDAFIEKKNCYLYMLGDRMQRIYDTYDGSFEKEFLCMNKELKLQINYRSAEEIINILNNLYNNAEYEQQSAKPQKYIPAYVPEVVFSADVEKCIEDKAKLYPDALILRLLNKERFDSACATNLYDTVSKMSKYKFGNKYGAVDVLTTNDKENPDKLFSLLFVLNELYQYYLMQEIGNIISCVRKCKQYLQTEWCILKKHEDKKIVKSYLEFIKKEFETEQSIKDMLLKLKEKEILKQDYVEDILKDEDYESVLEVSVKEFISLVDYLKKPHVSTQHGVKGEGHDTIFFVAENSKNNPVVNMYKMFELWSMNEIEISEFEKFSFEFNFLVNTILSRMGKKISDMKSGDYAENKELIDSLLMDFKNKHEDNIYFTVLLSDFFDEYFSKSNFTRVKNCLSVSKVEGVLVAFKLFYVGCSRARKNLSIIIDKNKIGDYKEQLREKFKKCGFKIV